MNKILIKDLPNSVKAVMYREYRVLCGINLGTHPSIVVRNSDPHIQKILESSSKWMCKSGRYVTYANDHKQWPKFSSNVANYNLVRDGAMVCIDIDTNGNILKLAEVPKLGCICKDQVVGRTNSEMQGSN